MSVAGGVHRAFERAASLDATSFQIFVKNQQQWRGKPLAAAEVEAYHEAASRSAVRWTMAHASYLINLASPQRDVWHRSRRALDDELQRCERLGIPYLVLHPGSHVGSGRERGIARIAAALRQALDRRPGRAQILLECTAGQGDSIGHRLEDLVDLLDALHGDASLGICLDTCHLFAAGVPLRGEPAYRCWVNRLRRMRLLDRVRAFHLNDAARPRGSRVDRHARLGEGHIGKAFFARLVQDRRFAALPMVLETPGGPAGYAEELAMLRRWARRAAP